MFLLCFTLMTTLFCVKFFPFFFFPPRHCLLSDLLHLERSCQNSLRCLLSFCWRECSMVWWFRACAVNPDSVLTSCPTLDWLPNLPLIGACGIEYTLRLKNVILMSSTNKYLDIYQIYTKFAHTSFKLTKHIHNVKSSLAKT